MNDDIQHNQQDSAVDMTGQSVARDQFVAGHDINIERLGDVNNYITRAEKPELLLEQIDRIPEAIDHVQEAITLFQDGLIHSAHGITVEEYEELLQDLQS